ncbi:MAG: TonB-dependent receptor domain-containing protein [Steroidobacteraceae bacterium]
MRFRIIAAILSVACIFGAGIGYAAISRDIAIPPQSLDTALRELAKVSDLQVVYRSEIVKDVRSPGAFGSLTPVEALTKVLYGTGLTYHYLDDKTVTLDPVVRAHSQMETSTPFIKTLALEPATPAPAATTVPPDNLQEIIVTAERRAERLQTVPIAMSALSGTTLEDLGLKGVADFAALVPNVSVGSGAGSGGTASGQGASSSRAIAIRGVFGNNTTAVYLNDTPIPMSVDPRAIDLERVEILRGPQGTLFGQGSMGGTVRLVTREPSLEKFSGMVEADGSYVEHGGAGYSTDGRANVVVVPDNLALRLSAFSSWDPGLYTRSWGGPQDPRSPSLPYPPGNISVGQQKHVGADQMTGVAATLAFTPTAVPGLNMTPMFMYQRSTSNGYPLADYTGNNFTQTRPFNAGESVLDTWSFASLTAKYDASFGRFVGSSTYFYRNATDNEDDSDIISIQLGLPYYVQATLPTEFLTKTYSHEVRFESQIPGPVQFVIGAFASDSTRRYLETLPAPGANAASGGALGTDLLYTDGTPDSDKERAEFLNVSYQVTTPFQISAGVRHSSLFHESDYRAGGPLNGGTTDIYTRHTETNTTPRFTAKYQFTDSQMIYASAAQGYRIGGANQYVPPQCASELSSLGLGNDSSYKSDSLWSFEVGSKNSWFGNRVKSRLAAYRINWKDLQQSLYLQCGFQITANSGYAVSRGIESEVDVALIDHLALTFALGYEDAKITEASPAAHSVVGQPLSDVPKWTGSTSAQYSVPMGADRSAFLRGDFSYTGYRTSFNNIPAPDGLHLSPFSVLNVRGGVNQGPWEFSLFVRNALNKYGVSGDLLPEGAILPNRPRLFVIRPRTIGLQLKRQF